MNRLRYSARDRKDCAAAIIRSGPCKQSTGVPLARLEYEQSNTGQMIVLNMRRPLDRSRRHRYTDNRIRLIVIVPQLKHAVGTV